MKTLLRLGWAKRGAPTHRAFKLPGAHAAFSEFVERCDRYAPCTVDGGPPEGSSTLWLCDRSPGSKVFSSEQLADKLSAVRDGGTQQLEIVIGPPDGYDAQQITQLKPNLRWSFGPLTLPHELAAVIAAEQFYRAWTILKREPYHLGH
jgi:23S rRNA (pseudouridine1915-N3)-methyltransferase